MNLGRFTAALFAATVLAGVAPVQAADMPLKAKAPIATYDWSGFYVGGVVGGALQNTVFTDKSGSFADSGWNIDGSGITAGVTAGWNHQIGRYVLGVEGDLNWDNFKGSFTDPDWFSHHSAKWNGFGTLRGRVGVAVDRVLMYATGGLAFVKVNDSVEG